MKTLIAATFIALASPAVACDAVVLHVASFHTDRDLIPDVNEANPGLGCRFDNVVLGASVEAGAYLNSYSEISPYAVVIGSPVGLSWFAGVAGGYAMEARVADHGYAPIAGLQYATEIFTVKAMPSYDTYTGELGAVFGFSLTF